MNGFVQSSLLLYRWSFYNILHNVHECSITHAPWCRRCLTACQWRWSILRGYAVLRGKEICHFKHNVILGSVVMDSLGIMPFFCFILVMSVLIWGWGSFANLCLTVNWTNRHWHSVCYDKGGRKHYFRQLSPISFSPTCLVMHHVIGLWHSYSSIWSHTGYNTIWSHLDLFLVT